MALAAADRCLTFVHRHSRTIGFALFSPFQSSTAETKKIVCDTTGAQRPGELPTLPIYLSTRGTTDAISFYGYIEMKRRIFEDAAYLLARIVLVLKYFRIKVRQKKHISPAKKSHSIQLSTPFSLPLYP